MVGNTIIVIIIMINFAIHEKLKSLVITLSNSIIEDSIIEAGLLSPVVIIDLLPNPNRSQ